MAVQMFMQIDDVKGESADNTHKDQIELQGWSWGASQTGSSHSNSGPGTGKCSVNDLTYQAYVDKSVPPILKMLLTGAPFQQAQLSICKATGGNPLDYIVIKMSNGLVSNVTFSGDPGDEVQKVSVSLNFAAVEFDYTPQDNQGNGLPAVNIQYQINASASG
jgi:type VI secretion system secreted protein Hcp